MSYQSKDIRKTIYTSYTNKREEFNSNLNSIKINVEQKANNIDINLNLDLIN